MKTEFENDFKTLHAAALTMATKMIAALQPNETEVLENATKQGGILLLQLGPLPDCQRIELVMREREGASHVIASIGASHD
jgi:hypothetical protein